MPALSLVYIFMSLLTLFEVFSWASYFLRPVTAEPVWGVEEPKIATNLHHREHLKSSEDQNSRSRKRKAAEMKAEDNSSAVLRVQQKYAAAKLRILDLKKMNEDAEIRASAWRSLCSTREAQLAQREKFHANQLKESENARAQLDASVTQLKAQNDQLREALIGPPQVAAVESPWGNNLRLEELRVQVAQHERRAKEVDAENRRKLREKDRDIQRLTETIARLRDRVARRDADIDALFELLEAWEEVIERVRYFCRLYHELREFGYVFCVPCLGWHQADEVTWSTEDASGSAEGTGDSMEETRSSAGESSVSGSETISSAAATRGSASPTPELESRD